MLILSLHGISIFLTLTRGMLEGRDVIRVVGVGCKDVPFVPFPHTGIIQLSQADRTWGKLLTSPFDLNTFNYLPVPGA